MMHLSRSTIHHGLHVYLYMLGKHHLLIQWRFSPLWKRYYHIPLIYQPSQTCNISYNSLFYHTSNISSNIFLETQIYLQICISPLKTYQDSSLGYDLLQIKHMFFDHPFFFPSSLQITRMQLHPHTSMQIESSTTNCYNHIIPRVWKRK